ncbi:DEAD/DEAH box helicase [Photobacterium japonica]|uniref:helicase-related protein n=1 Tax=Photobacterium japonica TaxID=2910235 RepID=UPI003D0F1AC1
MSLQLPAFQLPIDAIQTDFITLLANDHLVVVAETGSGKSTRLPVWSATRGRVLVVEPRRVACSALAEFIAQCRGEKVGQSVGYAIRFDNQFHDDSEIVFVTPGVALRWLSEDGLATFNTIIIDEFHERRWDTDLLLAMLKVRDSHRLVVTSATLDSDRLTAYLQGQSLRAEGRNFAVTVSYIASDSRNMPESRHLDSQVTKVVEQHYREHQDILVFLPGRKEIAQCLANVKKALHADIDAGFVDVIPLHASVTDAERHRALTESDKQRIIFATNVAETSVTIPGVTLIIDSGLERRTHQRNGRTVLGLHAISRASAEQRKGRAGRVRDGHCIRLFGQAAPLDLITPPELHREELVEPMLAAACCGYRLDALDFVDSVPEKARQQAFDRLKQMQAIDEDGRATAQGHILYPLPIDTLFAYLITAMPDKASREAMVDLSAALSVYQRVWNMPSGEERLEKLAKWEPLHCDAMTLIKLLRGHVPEWLDIDPNVLAEARMLAEQMRAALDLPMLEVATTVRREAWLKAVMTTAPELVFVRRERRRQALGNGYCEVSVARDCRYPDTAEAAIVFDQFALPGKGVKQNMILATCMAPVPLAWLNDLTLGEEAFGGTKVTDDGCWVEHQRVYAGRVIHTEWALPQGESAHDALVDLVVDGLLLEGLADIRHVDIHQWNLYLALGRYDANTCPRTPEPVVLRSWLSEQLSALGVESADDLEWFSPDDFPFVGIPDWERADFDSEFPHRVALTDLEMEIEYHVTRKLVVAVHVNGKRKPDPKRWELPRWHGWKVQYRKASRIIDIR